MSELDSAPTEVLNATFCATLVDEWIRSGVTHAMIAPGSRSTPLAIAISDRTEISVHIHHDERAAAFMALGLGLSSGTPAVVLTTSGTAAVELHPAVVEAHQGGVPLIVVTADRPPELRDVGAPQTVDQTHLFGSSVRFFTDPGPPSACAASTWRSLGSRVFVEAVGAMAGPGPVHLNLPFREPLLGVPVTLPNGRPGGQPWHRRSASRSVDGLARFPWTELVAAERGVLVVGARCQTFDGVFDLAAHLRWPILADPRSGCRRIRASTVASDVVVVTTADTWLRSESHRRELQPDFVLRIGEPHTSKVVGTWLAELDAVQVAVEPNARWFDADRTASHLFAADADSLVADLVDEESLMADVLQGRRSSLGRRSWLQRWADLEERASATMDVLLDPSGSESLTEPAVARVIAGVMARRTGPPGNLVVSSSMPVRDLEWYGGLTGFTKVWANRGANGIDGVVSTAVGVALNSPGRRNLALVGDVAFLHDSNALLGLAARKIDLTIVVVNNDGGGIFSFLPPARSLSQERFELLFATPHGVDLSRLVEAHGLRCIDLELGTSNERFRHELATSLHADGVTVLIVNTDRSANVAAHDAIHAAVHLSDRGDPAG